MSDFPFAVSFTGTCIPDFFDHLGSGCHWRFGPNFSSLNAQTAPREFVGTALTIAVSIGFLLTIPSIQLLGYLSGVIETRWLLFTLFIGPLFGLIYTKRLITT